VAKCLVNFGRESLGLSDIYATVETGNLASRRVLEKAGLRFYRKEYDEQGVFFVYRTPENSE
jgi:RimJ/RimL family protein N-acetyltransferase